MPEKLYVPFDAITGFFDPSVKFGLKFEPLNQTADGKPEKCRAGPREIPPAQAAEAAAESPPTEARRRDRKTRGQGAERSPAG